MDLALIVINAVLLLAVVFLLVVNYRAHKQRQSIVQKQVTLMRVLFQRPEADVTLTNACVADVRERQNRWWNRVTGREEIEAMNASLKSLIEVVTLVKTRVNDDRLELSELQRVLGECREIGEPLCLEKAMEAITQLGGRLERAVDSHSDDLDLHRKCISEMGKEIEALRGVDANLMEQIRSSFEHSSRRFKAIESAIDAVEKLSLCNALKRMMGVK